MSLARMGGPMGEPTGNARARFSERHGLVVCVHGAHGLVGLGEASPLPGHSPDTLDTCESELHACARSLERTVALADIPDLCAGLRAPAARFALESALLDLLARHARVPMAYLLAGMTGLRVRESVPVCALLDPFPEPHAAAVDQALERVHAAYRRGARWLKIKLGREGAWPRELALLRAIRTHVGHDLALRLDINEAWSPAEAADKLARLAEFTPEYVEDPCAEVYAPAPVPVAVDQALSALSDAAIEALLESGAIAAVVLKPMVLGGALRCLALAARARTRGVRAVASHLLDGPIAYSACAQMALLLETTPGLDAHAGLGAWPAISVPQRHRACVRMSARHGLGLSERALFAPRDHLSISGRARDSADALALVTAEQSLTYGDLRALVDQLDLEPAPDLPGLLPIAAERTVDTVVRLMYALEQRVPAILLSPRTDEPERAQQMALSRSFATNEHAHAPGSLALVLFTSGSRGQPKGVLIARSALLASAAASAANLGWRDDDRWLCALPLAHIGGLSIITRSMLAGRPFVLAPEGSFDPPGVAALMERTRVTLASFVPTMLSRLLDIGWSPPAHLRAVLLGGAPAPIALLARARERGVPVLTSYGMTETCAQICTQPYADTAPGPPGPGLVGTPLPGVELEIRQGRIFVRGDMLLSGYLGAPTPMDERGFFDTGDLGALDDRGWLQVYGRADETIITGGENIDPTEVEHALLEHPDIRAACVFGVADETWGQLVAMAVTSDRALAAADLARFVRQRLPAHKRPRLWCQLSELATGEGGKARRAHIAARASTCLEPLVHRP